MSSNTLWKSGSGDVKPVCNLRASELQDGLFDKEIFVREEMQHWTRAVLLGYAMIDAMTAIPTHESIAHNMHVPRAEELQDQFKNILTKSKTDMVRLLGTWGVKASMSDSKPDLCTKVIGNSAIYDKFSKAMGGGSRSTTRQQSPVNGSSNTSPEPETQHNDHRPCQDQPQSIANLLQETRAILPETAGTMEQCEEQTSQSTSMNRPVRGYSKLLISWQLQLIEEKIQQLAAEHQEKILELDVAADEWEEKLKQLSQQQHEARLKYIAHKCKMEHLVSTELAMIAREVDDLRSKM